MAEMVEFTTRANYGLRCGNFEMDMRDGEIRYKVFVDCEGSFLPPRDVIRNSIVIPAMMFERYTPGILDILFKEAKAVDAIAKCEE